VNLLLIFVIWAYCMAHVLIFLDLPGPQFFLLAVVTLGLIAWLV